jgi:hypothetical protein
MEYEYIKNKLEKYDNMIDIDHKKLENYVKDMKYFIQKKGHKYKDQIGGTSEITGATKSVSTLIDSLNLMKQIESEDIKTKRKELHDKVRTLIEKIEKIQNNSNKSESDKIFAENFSKYVMSSFDALSVQYQNLNNKFETNKNGKVNTEIKKIELPIRQPDNDLMKIFADVTNAMKTGQSELSDQQKSEVLKKINKQMPMIDKEIEIHKKANELFENYLKEIPEIDKNGPYFSYILEDAPPTTRVFNNLLMNNSINLLENTVNKIDEETKEILEQGSISRILSQTGGTGEESIEEKYLEYLTKMNQYNSELKMRNLNDIHRAKHNIFLLQIATGTLFGKGYVIENVFEKNEIYDYSETLKKIVNKFNSMNTERDDLTMRMYKLHYVTVRQLHFLLKKVLSEWPIQPKKETGKRRESAKKIWINKMDDMLLRDRFMLFNYFKQELDEYKIRALNPIMIYAKINFDTDEKQIFMTQDDYNEKYKSEETQDYSLMYIEKKNCNNFTEEKNLPNLPDRIKFSYVFGSEIGNKTIATNMKIATKLSKNVGTAIMTYGYSGTGKTYTLFGNKSQKVEGIMQSVLSAVTPKSVNLRVFEIHGYGMPYPYYWGVSDPSEKKDIVHNIYHYNIKIDASENIVLNTVNNSQTRTYSQKEISEYVNTEPTQKSDIFVNIPTSIVDKVLRSFDEFTDSIDTVREAEKRIERTPNNPVSSRAIIVYDFRLDIDGTVTPFIIIDLPGREEIIPSYVDAYLDNDTVSTILMLNKPDRKKELRFMLSCMHLNPLAIPLFYPQLYENMINNRYTKYKEKDNTYENTQAILDKKLKMKFFKKVNANENSSKEVIEYKIDDKTTFKLEFDEGPFAFNDEYINLDGSKVDRFLKPQTKGKGYQYELTKNGIKEFQRYAVLGINIMNRLILMNQFHLIGEIYEDMCYDEINKTIENTIDKKNLEEIKKIVEELFESKFKGNYMFDILYNRDNKKNNWPKLLSPDERNMKYENDIVKQKYLEKMLLKKITDANLSKIKEYIINVLKYDYFLTGFAGIYINENIMGLTTYLTKNLSVENKQKTEESLAKIREQEPKLNFSLQQKITRIWLASIDSIEKNDFAKFFAMSEDDVPPILIKNFDKNPKSSNAVFDYKNVDFAMKNLEIYQSDRIFNKDRPLIGEILEYYLQDKKDENGKVTKEKLVKDYKVFYLFGNEPSTRELKCSPQLKLLEKTIDFIKIIAGE